MSDAVSVSDLSRDLHVAHRDVQVDDEEPPPTEVIAATLPSTPTIAPIVAKWPPLPDRHSESAKLCAG